MSEFDLELLSERHDRVNFRCGRESLEAYLKETARGHLQKGISVTRVLVKRSANEPKPILGYFTLTTVLAEARNWPNIKKGLPRTAVPVVLLGRLAVANEAQGKGIGHLLLAAAREIAATSLRGTGGVGLAVDAASEELVEFYEKYGFHRIAVESLRLFMPTKSLEFSV